MTEKRKKRAELEARFIKRFSASKFVALLNTNESLQRLVEQELRSALADFLAEVARVAEGNLSAVINLQDEEVESALLVGPPDRVLQRPLYQQSIFFNEIPYAVLNVRDGAARLQFHRQVGIPLKATAILPQDLNAFNRYALLHLLPYLRKKWKETADIQRETQMLEAAQAVVMDKIGGIREALEDAVDDEA